jgi:hypothetical protein
MTIDELLTELDTFPRPGIPSYEGALEDAARLIRAAASTIRTLREVILGGERDATLVIHENGERT